MDYPVEIVVLPLDMDKCVSCVQEHVQHLSTWDVLIETLNLYYRITCTVSIVGFSVLDGEMETWN